MIITYDLSQLDNIGSDIIQAKDKIEKSMKIVVKFFHDLLTVLPKIPLNSQYRSNVCYDIKISEEEQRVYRDTDLHLYINLLNSDD